METGRELFNAFLKGERTTRPLYVPLFSALVARIGGMSFEAMNRDPALWTSALGRTADLFDLDAIVAGADSTLLPEACGCALRWEEGRPVVAGPPSTLVEAPEQNGRLRDCLEAARRVFQVARARRGCVAALTGPVTLAAQLFGPEEGPNRLADAKQLVTLAAQAFCGERPDILFFLEGGHLGGEITPAQRRAYNTLKNVASYYDIPSALFVQDYDPAEAARLAALKMDMYVLGPTNRGELPPSSAALELAQEALSVGVCLPLDDATRADEVIAEWEGHARSGRVRSFFFTSFEPADRETDVDAVHRIARQIIGAAQ